MNAAKTVQRQMMQCSGSWHWFMHKIIRPWKLDGIVKRSFQMASQTVQIGTNWMVVCRISITSQRIALMLHWSCHAANFQMHRHCQPNGRKISAVLSNTWKWCIKVLRELWPITMAIRSKICRCSLRVLNRNRCEPPNVANIGDCYCRDNTMFKSLALGKHQSFGNCVFDPINHMKELVLMISRGFFPHSTDTNPVKSNELLSSHSDRPFSISAWHRLNQSKVFIKPMQTKTNDFSARPHLI